MDLLRERIKGADVSSLLEVEENGGRFFDRTTGSGQQAGEASVSPAAEEDALVILKRHGVNLIRLRLWNDPYDENGRPYGAGTNDLPRTMELARRCRELGLPWMLDFHYSDFWADPGKQYPPKAWAGLDANGLTQAIFSYTRGTLRILKEAGLLPSVVAVGNEISNGLLWPLGEVPTWMNVARFVSAGLRAVKAVDPSIQTMIHLDNGGWYGLYRSWFDSYRINGGADFDLIGLSWYPFWHGSLTSLRFNMEKLAATIGKPMLVTETSMAFTLRECCDYEGLTMAEKRGLAANERTAAEVPWPITPEGQCAFLRELWDAICSVPKKLCRGFVWWEPAWLPVRGSGWTTEAGLRYVREKGPGGNEWANQGTFDYDGRALPVLDTLEALR